MTSEERMMALCKATPEMKRAIDAVLAGKDIFAAKKDKHVNLRLLTITECCSRLGMNYQKFRRRMQEGLFDTVHSGGKTLIREESLIEFALGRRKPTDEALAKKAEINEARRSTYHARKALAANHNAAKVKAALGWN